MSISYYDGWPEGITTANEQNLGGAKLLRDLVYRDGVLGNRAGKTTFARFESNKRAYRWVGIGRGTAWPEGPSDTAKSVHLIGTDPNEVSNRWYAVDYSHGQFIEYGPLWPKLFTGWFGYGTDTAPRWGDKHFIPPGRVRSYLGEIITDAGLRYAGGKFPYRYAGAGLIQLTANSNVINGINTYWTPDMLNCFINVRTLGERGTYNSGAWLKITKVTSPTQLEVEIPMPADIREAADSKHVIAAHGWLYPRGMYDGQDSFIDSRIGCEFQGRWMYAGIEMDTYDYKTARDSGVPQYGSMLRWSSTPDASEREGLWYGPNRVHPSAYMFVFPEVGGDITGLMPYRGSLVILKQGAVVVLKGDLSTDGEDLGHSLEIVDSFTGNKGAETYDLSEIGVVFADADWVYVWDGESVRNLSIQTIGRHKFDIISCIPGYVICNEEDTNDQYVFDIEQQAWTVFSAPGEGYGRVIATGYSDFRIRDPLVSSTALCTRTDQLRLVRFDSDWKSQLGRIAPYDTNEVAWNSANSGHLDAQDEAVINPRIETHRLPLSEDVLSTSRPREVGMDIEVMTRRIGRSASFLLQDASISGGTWRLSIGGLYSDALAWNATSGQVKTAAEQLVGSGNVRVEGVSLASGYRLFYQGSLRETAESRTWLAHGVDLVGLSSEAALSASQRVQYGAVATPSQNHIVAVQSQVVVNAGEFTLGHRATAGGSYVVVNKIPWNTSSSALRQIVADMIGTSVANISVTGESLGAGYLIEAIGALANTEFAGGSNWVRVFFDIGDAPLISASDSSTTYAYHYVVQPGSSGAAGADEIWLVKAELPGGTAVASGSTFSLQNLTGSRGPFAWNISASGLLAALSDPPNDTLYPWLYPGHSITGTNIVDGYTINLGQTADYHQYGAWPGVYEVNTSGMQLSALSGQQIIAASVITVGIRGSDALTLDWQPRGGSSETARVVESFDLNETAGALEPVDQQRLQTKTRIGSHERQSVGSSIAIYGGRGTLWSIRQLVIHADDSERADDE